MLFEKSIVKMDFLKNKHMPMRVAFVGPFSFPSSNANSQRINGIVDALIHCGNQVMVFPGIKSTEINDSPQKNPASGIHIQEINEYGNGFASKLKPGIRGLFLGDITVQWLKSLPKKPDVVMLYGTHLGYLLRLIKFCKQESIRLILDVVEWYDPRHLPGGLIGPFTFANELSMRWVVLQADALIVISSYLENYYASKGCQTLRVPPIFSVFPPRPRQLREDNGLLNLCYVGTPGKKEEFEVLLDGLRLAVDAGVKLKMHIAGITAAEFIARFPFALSLIDKDAALFQFYGRLPNHAVRQLVSAADFLLIARRPIRFANAGFPFKISESMMLGTPVISNCFSDVAEYIQDGINSLLMNTLSSVEVAKTVIRGSALNETARTKMQDSARLTAKRVFSVDSNSGELNAFIRHSKNSA